MNLTSIYVLIALLLSSNNGGDDPKKPKPKTSEELNPKALSVKCYNKHPKANVATGVPIKTNLFSGLVVKIANQPDIVLASPVDVTNTGTVFTFSNPWGKRTTVDVSASLSETNSITNLYNYLETCETTPTVGAGGDASAANQLILNTRIESAIDTLKNIQDTLSAILLRQALLADESDQRNADSLGVLIALSRTTAANRPSSTWESDSLFIKATNDSLGVVIDKLGDGIGGSDSLFIKASNDSLGRVIELLETNKAGSDSLFIKATNDSLGLIRSLLLDLKNDQISSIDTLSLIKNSSDTVVARLTEMLDQGLGSDSLFIKANTDSLSNLKTVLQDSLGLVIEKLKAVSESLDTIEKYIKPPTNAFGSKGTFVDSIKVNNYLVDMDSLIYLSVENLGTVEASIVWNGVIVPLGALTNGKGLPTIRYYEARYDQRSKKYIPLGTIILNASGTKLLISASKHQ